MTEPTRKYDASRRQRQAQATRSRIIEAARELFIERGYAGTTLAAIADRADVALPTVYGAVGSKRALIADMIEGSAAAVSDGSIRVLSPDDLAAVLADPDPRTQVRSFAARVAKSLDAAYELLVALRAAAGIEDEANELERRVQAQRLTDIRAFTTQLGSAGALRSDVTALSAAETIWVLTDLQSFRMLVKDRGWSLAKYRKWLAAALDLHLLR